MDRVISLACSTAMLPPDPVVAHITRVVPSRLSTARRLQCQLETVGPPWASVPECSEMGKTGKLLISLRKDCVMEYTRDKKKKTETWSINSRQAVDCGKLKVGILWPIH